MSTTRKEREEVIRRLARLGIDYHDAQALRRIAMTLHRWYELECGDSNGWSLERDETTGKPVMSRYSDRQPMKRLTYPIPDREKGALKRLGTLLKKYPTLTPYVQTDPRGASLYLLTQDTLDRYALPIDQCYSNGTAIY